MAFDWTRHRYPDEAKGLMIKQARKRLRMTQPQFGELVGAAFLTVYQWENGRRIPRFWRLICLALKEEGISFDSAGVLIDSPKWDKRKKIA